MRLLIMNVRIYANLFIFYFGLYYIYVCACACIFADSITTVFVPVYPGSSEQLPTAFSSGSPYSMHRVFISYPLRLIRFFYRNRFGGPLLPRRITWLDFMT